MTLSREHQARLVFAAQQGDARARDELIGAHLPLLYNIVGRALGGHADVDDVVQETLLRAVRDLRALRDPRSFRSWLVAIAIRQIGTHRYRQRSHAEQTLAFAETEELPVAGVSFEDMAIARMQVSAQRHEIARAGRWIDPQDRTLLALWWQENAGWLNRGEVAAALGLTVAHTGVRLQRMREQLDLARAIEAALHAQPICAVLAGVVSRWDGSHTPLWRKRIGRHVRGCPVCSAAAAGRLALERLLLGLTPLAVPAGLAATLAAKGLLSGAVAGTSAAAGPTGVAGGVHATLIGKVAQVLASHPLATLAGGAALAVGTTATYVNWPGPVQPPAAVIAVPATADPAPVPSPFPVATTPRPPRNVASVSPRPSASADAAGVPLGARSLESVAQPGWFLSYAGDFATLEAVTAASDTETRRRSTVTVVAGLADPACVTLRAADGRYLRHSQLRLRLSPADGSTLFREDATFCVRPGKTSGSVVLQAYNYPALVLVHRDGAIYIDVPDGSATFDRQSSFVTRSTWAR